MTQNIKVSKHGSIKDNTKLYETYKENFLKESILRSAPSKDNVLK